MYVATVLTYGRANKHRVVREREKQRERERERKTEKEIRDSWKQDQLLV